MLSVEQELALTKLFVEWSEVEERYQAVSAELMEVSSKIEAKVKELQASKTVGDVYARFTKAGFRFDYEVVGGVAPSNIIEKNTTWKPVVSWAKVCADAHIMGVPRIERPATVSISRKKAS